MGPWNNFKKHSCCGQALAWSFDGLARLGEAVCPTSLLWGLAPLWLRSSRDWGVLNYYSSNEWRELWKDVVFLWNCIFLKLNLLKGESVESWLFLFLLCVRMGPMKSFVLVKPGRKTNSNQIIQTLRLKKTSWIWNGENMTKCRLGSRKGEKQGTKQLFLFFLLYSLTPYKG